MRWTLLVCVLAACGGGSTDDGGVDPGTDAGKADGGREDDAGRSEDAGRGSDAATGGPCDFDFPCPAGQVCTGAGCDDLAWTCQPAGACTDDEATFCGCDGELFVDSSTCPRIPFAHLGGCDFGSVNCDPRDVACFETPAPCRDGMVREVRLEGCWGDCVAIDRCSCVEDDECPFAGELYVCDPSFSECAPIE